jgi:hypothetical protein
MCARIDGLITLVKLSIPETFLPVRGICQYLPLFHWSINFTFVQILASFPFVKSTYVMSIDDLNPESLRMEKGR